MGAIDKLAPFIDARAAAYGYGAKTQEYRHQHA